MEPFLQSTSSQENTEFYKRLTFSHVSSFSEYNGFPLSVQNVEREKANLPQILKTPETHLCHQKCASKRKFSLAQYALLLELYVWHDLCLSKGILLGSLVDAFAVV